MMGRNSEMGIKDDLYLQKCQSNDEPKAWRLAGCRRFDRTALVRSMRYDAAQLEGRSSTIISMIVTMIWRFVSKSLTS